MNKNSLKGRNSAYYIRRQEKLRTAKNGSLFFIFVSIAVGITSYAQYKDLRHPLIQYSSGILLVSILIHVGFWIARKDASKKFVREFKKENGIQMITTLSQEKNSKESLFI